MIYRFLADVVVVLHLLFVLFAVLGGLLLIRTPKIAWLHVPALCWAVIIEWAGWLCPLTPLEIRLRHLGGETAYDQGFVEHYLVPLLYPAALTRRHQLAIGLLLLAFNLIVYLLVWRQRKANP